MLPWFRFWDRTLESKKAQALDGTTFKRWVNLLALANRGTPRGTLPIDIEEIRFALRLSRLSTVTLLKYLIERAFIDELPDGTLRMHNWPKWQPESDDAAARMKETRIRAQAEPIPNKDRTRSAPDTDTDPEKIQIQNPPSPTSPPPIGAERVSPDDLMAIWNELIPGPKVHGLSGKRLAAARRRIAEHYEPSWWRAVIAKVATTPFLRGAGPRGWKASFDWLMSNDTNALRVLEGTYGDMTPGERKAQMEAMLNDDRRHREDSHPVRGRLPSDVHLVGGERVVPADE